ncbi:MAG: hypothetical protein J3Q66DRAFT_348378 [Benniella sp.]|nr:MAG: hypothetical protein J3Q66DRAFT_348378 [Benniella sp.]
MSNLHQLGPQEKQDTLVGAAEAGMVGGNRDDDFGDFGDFGTVPSGAVGTQAGGNDDDDFGDFGGAPEAGKVGGNGDDDFGDFGDFGQVQATGDDDFGGFNDFSGGNNTFQDTGDFGDFEGTTDSDAFGAPEPAPVEPQPQPPVQVEEAPPVEPAPDFNPVNSRQVETYVLEKLAALYPIDDQAGDQTCPNLLNLGLEEVDVASILSDQQLWISLCEQSFQGGNHTVQSPLSKSAPSVAPQFQWKYSDLRKEYYASLGLTIAAEQITPTPSSIPSSFTNSRSKVTSSMIVNAETIPERKPLDVDATRAYCQFTRENLGGYSGDELKDIVARLTDLTRQVFDELTYWLDQREQMIMDSERYNDKIRSLVNEAGRLVHS